MVINVYLFLGGLHLLMSCIDVIVTLIGETGLAEVLKSFISCFLRMMMGTKYSQNVRDLRIIAEELL